MQGRAGRASERTRAGDEIGVDVRLRDVGDPHSIGAGGPGVQSDVGVGIDYDRLARLFASDQVARLRQILVVKSSEKHRRLEETCGSVAQRVNSS